MKNSIQYFTENGIPELEKLNHYRLKPVGSVCC